jgi:hypothetical protein
MSISTRQALTNGPGRHSSEPEQAGLLSHRCGCGKGHGFGGGCSACRSEQSVAPLDLKSASFSRGSVANVHQVHFHLSKGHPRDVRAVRLVNRTAHAFGKDWPESKYDGPPVHEYRFTKDKMVIADAPGWCKNMPDYAFPVNYKADFSMYAFDAATMKVLASISYHVEISKSHFSDPGATNYVEVIDTKIGAAVPRP